jgi:hypothetical protein
MTKTAMAVLSTSLFAAVVIGGTASVVPTAKAASFGSSSSASVTNLAAGASIQTQTDGPVDAQFSSLESSYSSPLTSMNSWHGFCRQNGRDITITLPSNADIQTISIQLEQNASMGIYYPSHVDFEAYSGNQWYKVASQDSVVPLTDKRLTTQTFRVNVNGLRTSQIRIHFPVGVWVFARRLEVFGTPNSSMGPTLPSGATVVQSQNYGQTGNYGGTRGIRNMLLVYTGADGSLGTWSPSDFLPMLAYYPQVAQTTQNTGTSTTSTSTSPTQTGGQTGTQTGGQSGGGQTTTQTGGQTGTSTGGQTTTPTGGQPSSTQTYTTPTVTTATQPTGWMFDTMLFTPFGSMSDTQAGWQSYLQDLFARGQELDALNTAVGQAHQATGVYAPEKVVLTIPYPSFGDGWWGYANGQSLSFNPTATDAAALKSREAALNWYIQTLLSDWNSQGYQNLQLTGLYWEQEDVQYNAPGEVNLIENTAKVVHQYGYGFYWIPFYDASGVTRWQSFGFDAAWLQSNFSEQGSAADIARVENAAEYARQNGMGLEVEMGGSPTDPQVQSLYLQNMSQFVTDGMTSSVSHAYYAGAKGLLQAFQSTDPATHALYDQTYNFITHP